MTTYAHEYTEKILHRGRVFMEPADFTPNWADKPRKQKYYPDAVRIPLGCGTADPGATVDKGVHSPGAGEGFDLDSLSGMLLDSYGLTGRRLAVQANTDLPGLPRYVDANYSRGTASGGGLYPISVYLVAGPSGDLSPGIYHYSPAHHALQRLVSGDVSGDVRAAVGGRADGVDTFAILGLKYWQNAFKYNSFSYHAVTMDLGTVLSTWNLWAGAHGQSIEPMLWFDEPALAELLGLVDHEEGVYAVVPLPQRTSRPVSTAGPSRGAVALRDDERSRVSYGFDAVEQMQRAAVDDSGPPPAPKDLEAARPRRDEGPQPIALPARRPLPTAVRDALRGRRSSFGRFVATPLDGESFGTLLAAAAAGYVPSECTSDPGDLVTVYAFVNHVQGLAPGAYRYDPDEHSLHLVHAGPQGTFLQDNYFLSNYNMEQTAAVLVPTIRTHAVLDAVGSRGYRLVNATIGAVSQYTYTAASALGVGCGVALGFDNISFIERLGLDADGEKPLLVMAIGHERRRPADFRIDLVEG